MEERIRQFMLREWHLREQWRRYEHDPAVKLTPDQEAVAAQVLGPRIKQMAWDVHKAFR
jgi:hypothetical protein